MSGRARVPIGASERTGLFGAKESLPANHSDLSGGNEVEGGNAGIPVAMHEQLPKSPTGIVPGSATATPYGVLSPGRRP